MKTVVIFGASSSVGRHIIELFLAKDYKVFAITHSKKRLEIENSRLTVLSLDLNSSEGINQFCTFELPEIVGIDILIFLNGVITGNPLADYPEKLMHEVMNVNFTSQAYLLKKIIPKLNPAARVIYTSSISGFKGSFDPMYAASKSAILGFIKSIAASPQTKFRINAIAPGLIANSKMFDDMDKINQDFHTQNTPTQTLTAIKDIAEIYVNLCEPCWSNLHGQVIHINGGVF